MRLIGGLIALLFLVWFAVGAIAAAQRHYFSSGSTNCAKAGTIAVTILAGPLNYGGANAKVNCQFPNPSS
jgi:hypothetical protein